MDPLTAALKQLESQMVIWIIPIIGAAILSYVTVYLFYHFGPLAKLRDEAGFNRRRSFDEDEDGALAWRPLR